MSTPYLGQVTIFGCNYAPKGWAQCNGQLLSISQNAALFSLLGVAYGGNGSTTFALPNLQSRVPIGVGQGTGLTNYTLGQMAGQETVALATAQLPTHSHAVNADASSGTAVSPSGGNLAQTNAGGRTVAMTYTTGAAANPAALNGNTISSAGSGQAHTNIQPSIAMNYCIAITGVYPSRP